MWFNATGLAIIQRQLLGWNYFSHILMIAIGIGMIAVSKGDFKYYGFTLNMWRYDLSIAVTCIIMIIGFIPFTSNTLTAAVFNITTTLVALGVVASKKNRVVEITTSQPISKMLSIAPIFLVKANALSGLGLIASTAVFQFFFVGFGEEILFRGYIQSRLNQDFGKPWSFRGVSFGPGLLISSVLFGVLHMLNTFNPFLRSYSLSYLWALTSCFSGLLFGYVREKTGTILSASLAHGLIDLGQIVPLII
jgi:membrane protease YdiL (CAAX protease family)